MHKRKCSALLKICYQWSHVCRLIKQSLQDLVLSPWPGHFQLFNIARWNFLCMLKSWMDWAWGTRLERLMCIKVNWSQSQTFIMATLHSRVLLRVIRVMASQALRMNHYCNQSALVWVQGWAVVKADHPWPVCVYTNWPPVAVNAFMGLFLPDIMFTTPTSSIIVIAMILISVRNGI